MTPHIKAQEGEIAKTVLMPGDPFRAKMVAEKYLTKPKLVSDVRGILAYTGKYKDKEITVIGFETFLFFTGYISSISTTQFLPIFFAVFNLPLSAMRLSVSLLLLCFFAYSDSETNIKITLSRFY